MTKHTIVKKLFSRTETKKSNSFGNEGPAEFETAVSALGYGKFNIYLFLILIPSQWALIFDNNLMSYISPIAQCDLDLSLNDKGTLNAITPIGAVIGGVFWGVLIDTLGRRNLILYGFILHAFLVIVTAVSQSYMFLLVVKLISGAVTGGLYLTQCTYYAELHSMEYRSKIQLSMGFIAGAGQVAIPLFSAFFLPLDVRIVLFGGYLKLHSWNLLILVTSVMSLMAGITFIFLPESPKFLMTKGNNEEALAVFRKIFRINTGRPEDSFPIQKLIHEQIESSYKGNEGTNTFINYIKNGWNQISPVFSKQYFPKLLLVTTIEFLTLTNMNTLRLWLPQIFQAISEYQVEHSGQTAQLCIMLETLKTSTNTSDVSTSLCTVNTSNNFSVYFNSMVNAGVCMIGYAMAGTLINMVGKKKLLCLLGLITTSTILTTYLSQNTLTTLTLTSLHLAVTGISFDVVMTMIVVIFPTTLRGTALSIVLMIGRLGTIVGNILFPILLKIGCAPPFFALGAIGIVGTFLCTLLPVSDNDSLK